MLDFQELLLSLGVMNLDGWELQSATGISADGRTIVGTGVFNGRDQAWTATIPEPSSLILGVAAALVVAFVLYLRCRLGQRPVTMHE